ncbi:MAG: Rrf2 family transcriptional regulator [Phycisphaerae bacterium]|nr:Rrf2 family transcriptional regulator [Phycisphaerae bacterium]
MLFYLPLLCSFCNNYSMLALSKKTDYGLIALCHLATAPEVLFSARKIAENYGMSGALLMNVLKSLTRNGLVESTRGVNGGYKLLRDPANITLAELVCAIEGPPKFVACAEIDRNVQKKDSFDQKSQVFDCNLAQACPVKSPVRKVHRKMIDFLEGITIADLVNDNIGQ